MLHPLLVRQLKRAGLSPDHPVTDVEAWRALLERVDKAYHEADQERYLLERSLALSSTEMRNALDKAHATNRDLEASRNELEASREEARRAWHATELASRAKSEFLANMSHEIRTPMTAILGFTDVLLDLAGSARDSELGTAAETIKRNGEHLLHLINDILDLSKIEAGKMSVDRARCNPRDIAHEVISLLRVRAEAKNISLGIEFLSATPETIVTDTIRLRQILLNLLGNAIKFTEVGSVNLFVFLEPDDAEPKLRFDVVDSGIGMTREELERLFQAFTQVDQSSTRRFGGSGLGLVISQRFARMLGGDVCVVHSKPGAGTRFRATIATGSLDGVAMIHDGKDAPRVFPSSTKSIPASPKLPPCKLLYAEDGPDNQRLISHILRVAGADVTVVENGQLAVDLVRERIGSANQFDFIFMDMQMPVLDGYSATGAIRQLGFEKPIVALTAHAMAGDREKCLACGCDMYMTKPVKRDHLIGVVRQFLSQAESASAIVVAVG